MREFSNTDSGKSGDDPVSQLAQWINSTSAKIRDKITHGRSGGGVTSFDEPVPTAVSDTFTASWNTPLTINTTTAGVLSNDTGTSISATLVTSPNSGTMTLNSNGSFTYTPNTGFIGQDWFSYMDANSTTTSNVITDV